jgi:hypothetical protein
MTHQVMNRSFGKALAVATIAVMISSAASAQAQQGRQGRDRCFHSMRVRPAVRVPMVPPVHMHPVPNGGRPYPDYRRDERLWLTRQHSAGMAAEQEATRARLLQIITCAAGSSRGAMGVGTSSLPTGLQEVRKSSVPCAAG